LLSISPPTAVQLSLLGHETPRKTARRECGLGWIDQPSAPHLSISANVCCPRSNDPTATHVLCDGHEMSSNSPPVAPPGIGACWINHLNPFQRSASGTARPPLVTDPTAMHESAVAQDTE
jgi:hypothetical protein